jgi:hypothetical protein
MDEIPIGAMDNEGNIDGAPFNVWMSAVLKDIQGSSAYSWDRNRPYNGQSHTDNGTRGKTLVVGLTMRDVIDCFVAGLLDCCGVDQPELYAQVDRPLHDLMYQVDLSKIDPGAWGQNMICRIEKMMGIYPNVPHLESEDE